MRMLMIIYDEVFEAEVMEALDQCGRVGYTKWQRVQGRGEKAEPRLGTGVWPGFNQVLMVVVEKDRCAPLLERLGEMKRDGSVKGLSAYVLPVEQII